MVTPTLREIDNIRRDLKYIGHVFGLLSKEYITTHNTYKRMMEIWNREN